MASNGGATRLVQAVRLAAAIAELGSFGVHCMKLMWLTSSLKLKTVCALGLLAASLGTIGVRNDVFEFCTTKAYGFPFPWYYDWCICERDSPRVNPVSCAFNVAFVVVGSVPLAAVLKRFRRATPGT